MFYLENFVFPIIIHLDLLTHVLSFLKFSNVRNIKVYFKEIKFVGSFIRRFKKSVGACFRCYSNSLEYFTRLKSESCSPSSLELASSLKVIN